MATDQPPTEPADSLAHLSDHVRLLASPEFGGRAPGSAGGVLARHYLTELVEGMGLVAVGLDGFHQAIPGHGGANVIGMLPGATDPDRFVLVSAHYDHLGSFRGHLYPGADDNAAAVAVLVETTRSLAERAGELARSVLVCAFDAEEPPYFITSEMGSVHFVGHPTVPLEHIDLVVNMDLVGHRLGPTVLPDKLQQSIIAQGEFSTGVADAMGDTVTEGIRPWRMPMATPLDLSDHYAFRRAGIPWMFLTTGRDRRYHTPLDTAEHIDVARLRSLTSWLTDFTISASRVESTASAPLQTEEYRQSVETIAAIWAALPNTTPDHDRAGQLLDELAKRVEANGGLTPAQVSSLERIVFMIEEALA